MDVKQEGNTKRMKFNVRHPWGSDFIDKIGIFFEASGFVVIQDPACEGSDSCGIVVSRDQTLIQKALDINAKSWDIDDDEPLVVELCRELDELGVFCFSADWKTFSPGDYEGTFAKMGISYSYREAPHYPTPGGDLDIDDFEFVLELAACSGAAVETGRGN
jgi:hypothetical protein